MSSAVAAAGAFLLASVAPFEATDPIVRLPGQALTNLEAAIFAALAAWAASIAMTRHAPRCPPVVRASFAVAMAMAVASLAAGTDARNAWHMTGRFVASAAVLMLTVNGITTGRRLHAALVVCVSAAAAVAVLAILEFAQVDAVLRLLTRFRPSLHVVGAQVRASGTLPYPTIASMYLEIAFAFGVGLLAYAVDRTRPARSVVWFVALLAIGDAIVLTFTRAGLLAMALILAIAGGHRLRHRGADRGLVWLGALAVGLAGLMAVSRSSQSLWLRMTSDGQNGWYRAAVTAPSTLSMTTDRLEPITVTVTNTGRTTWDSSADPPVALSYHWLQADTDGVVAFNGERTAFERPVAPGETVSVRALVRAPQYPGRFRLEWDLVQEGRLWFSTEQDAPPSTLTGVTVTGAAVAAPGPVTPHPTRAVRPGRVVLWQAAARMIAAHPLLGVGPDNFRLQYGRYAGLTGADPRTHSNNMYLETLAGGGLLAGVAFAWLLRETGRLVRRAAASADARFAAVAAACIAIAVHGVVDSFLSFGPTYVLFAVTLGLAAAAGGMEISADAHRL